MLSRVEMMLNLVNFTFLDRNFGIYLQFHPVDMIRRISELLFFASLGCIQFSVIEHL